MKPWNEKTKVEKIADIISGIALCIWVIFEYLTDKNSIPHADTYSCIAIGVVCICEAVSFWNVKRVLSYVAIAGVVCIATTMILLAL